MRHCGVEHLKHGNVILVFSSGFVLQHSPHRTTERTTEGTTERTRETHRDSLVIECTQRESIEQQNGYGTSNFSGRFVLLLLLRWLSFIALPCYLPAYIPTNQPTSYHPTYYLPLFYPDLSCIMFCITASSVSIPQPTSQPTATIVSHSSLFLSSLHKNAPTTKQCAIVGIQSKCSHRQLWSPFQSTTFTNEQRG